MKKMTIKNSKTEINTDAKLGKSIAMLLYSDVVIKGGVKLSYKEYKKQQNLSSLLNNNIIKDAKGNSIVKFNISHIGFLNVIVTQRINFSKFQYCVRIMNSDFSHTHKVMFVAFLSEVEECLKDDPNFADVDLKLTDKRPCLNNTILDTVKKSNADAKKIANFKTNIKNNVISLTNTAKKVASCAKKIVCKAFEKIGIKLAADVILSKLNLNK